MAKTKKNNEKIEKKSDPIVLEESEITDKLESVDTSKKGLSKKMDDFKAKQKEAQAVEDADRALMDENNIEQSEATLSGGEKTLAAIAYISFFCILTLLLKRDSEFCQFHGKQGVVLVIITLILTLFGGILGYIHPIFDILIMLFIFGVMVYGIYLGIKGERKKIPLIGQLAEKLDFS